MIANSGRTNGREDRSDVTGTKGSSLTGPSIAKNWSSMALDISGTAAARTLSVIVPSSRESQVWMTWVGI
jgi:hypothetical protein